jgi:hypothetical protein
MANIRVLSTVALPVPSVGSNPWPSKFMSTVSDPPGCGGSDGAVVAGAVTCTTAADLGGGAADSFPVVLVVFPAADDDALAVVAEPVEFDTVVVVDPASTLVGVSDATDVVVSRAVEVVLSAAFFEPPPQALAMMAPTARKAIRPAPRFLDFTAVLTFAQRP